MKNCLVLLSDIGDFSLLPQGQQEDVVRQLWFVALGDEFILNGPAESHMWGTGDGFYFVTWELDDAIYRRMYEFGTRLITQMENLNIALRIALHSGYGQMLHVGAHDEERYEVAGTGLNDVARIISFAAPGQVVISERFYDDWPRSDRQPLHKDLTPADADEPFVVFVKHGMRMRVRFDSAVASKKMQFSALVIDLIDQELKQVGTFVESLLGRSDPDDLRVRVSIFRITSDGPGGERYLQSTSHRHCRFAKVSVKPSNTRYSISQSVPGRACLNREPLFIANLPSPTDHPVEYQNCVAEAWEIPAEDVARWRRKARSFFIVPLGIDPDDHYPSGIVCVDSDDPLEVYSDDVLDHVCRQIYQKVMGRLALLWKLRE